MTLSDRIAWRPWARCRSLEDLCRVSARYWQGELPFSPVHDSPPPEAALEHSELLAACCRAGFAADEFSPVRDRLSWPELPHVSGYLTGQDYGRLAGCLAASRGAEFLAACGHGSHEGHRPADCPRHDADHWFRRNCPRASAAILGAVYVVAIAPDPDDPQPLWDALAFYAAGNRS